MVVGGLIFIGILGLFVLCCCGCASLGDPSPPSPGPMTERYGKRARRRERKAGQAEIDRINEEIKQDEIRRDAARMRAANW